MGAQVFHSGDRRRPVAYIPEQSALKPHRRHRIHPLIFASCRVSPQFSQKSTGVDGDAADGTVTEDLTDVDGDAAALLR